MLKRSRVRRVPNRTVIPVCSWEFHDFIFGEEIVLVFMRLTIDLCTTPKTAL